jgi:hypothetical protein
MVELLRSSTSLSRLDGANKPWRSSTYIIYVSTQLLESKMNSNTMQLSLKYSIVVPTVTRIRKSYSIPAKSVSASKKANTKLDSHDTPTRCL